MNEDIVDKIYNGKANLKTKIIRLWAVTMLNYQEPLGVKAWATITRLTNKDVSAAIAYLTGWCMRAGSTTDKKLKELLSGYVDPSRGTWYCTNCKKYYDKPYTGCPMCSGILVFQPESTKELKR